MKSSLNSPRLHLIKTKFETSLLSDFVLAMVYVPTKNVIFSVRLRSHEEPMCGLQRFLGNVHLNAYSLKVSPLSIMRNWRKIKNKKSKSSRGFGWDGMEWNGEGRISQVAMAKFQIPIQCPMPLWPKFNGQGMDFSGAKMIPMYIERYKYIYNNSAFSFSAIRHFCLFKSALCVFLKISLLIHFS
jgi:hypothetical protein